MTAAELERELKERAPLLRWRVAFDGPCGECGEYGDQVWVRATLPVGESLLNCGTRVSLELLKVYPDAATEILHRTAQEMGTAILAWRPAGGGA